MVGDGFSSDYQSSDYRKTSDERASYWGVAFGLQAVDGSMGFIRPLDLT
jgi:hypothetical protein